ncbi:MAG: large conductance mechanosensitive channel protein MscL [Ginsengibacter sp.]
MGLIKEFREFAIKGKILDLAVAVVIGAAFSKIVTSLVTYIIMPIIGIFIGNRFETLEVKFRNVPIKYGLFIEATMDFFIVAFVLFLAVKAANKINKKKEVIQEIKLSQTEILLTEIRDILKK